MRNESVRRYGTVTPRSRSRRGRRSIRKNKPTRYYGANATRPKLVRNPYELASGQSVPTILVCFLHSARNNECFAVPWIDGVPPRIEGKARAMDQAKLV